MTRTSREVIPSLQSWFALQKSAAEETRVFSKTEMTDAEVQVGKPVEKIEVESQTDREEDGIRSGEEKPSSHRITEADIRKAFDMGTDLAVKAKEKMETLLMAKYEDLAGEHRALTAKCDRLMEKTGCKQELQKLQQQLAESDAKEKKLKEMTTSIMAVNMELKKDLASATHSLKEAEAKDKRIEDLEKELNDWRKPEHPDEELRQSISNMIGLDVPLRVAETAKMCAVKSGFHLEGEELVALTDCDAFEGLKDEVRRCCKRIRKFFGESVSPEGSESGWSDSVDTQNTSGDDCDSEAELDRCEEFLAWEREQA